MCLLRYSVIRKKSQFLELVWNSCDRYGISEYHNKSSQILCWLKCCLWCVRDLWSRVTLAMVLTENKSKCLLVVHHTRIMIHHHACSATALVNKHQISILQFSIGSEVCTQDRNLQTNRQTKSKDVSGGKLNCSFGQRDCKTLLKGSLEFWFDIFLHPWRKTWFPRRFKLFTCVSK